MAFLDGRRGRPPGEANVDFIAFVQGAGIANDGLAVADDGITALERRLRADRLQSPRQRVQALVQPAQLVLDGAPQAQTQFIEFLPLLIEQLARVRLRQALFQPAGFLTFSRQIPPRQAAQPVQVPRQRVQPFPLVGHRDLGRGRWGRCAHIGDEIGDREIDLVADPGYHRDRTVEDRLRHRFFVKRPKILERAAATGQDQQIAGSVGLGQRQGADDLAGGGLSLHRNRVNQHLGNRKPALQNMQDIPDRGAGRRGHDTDFFRRGRQRLLAIGVEQTGIEQFFLEPFEFALQTAFAGFLHALDDQLIIAPGLVNTDPGADQDLHAHGRPEAEPAILASEHRARNLGLVVLQRKIHVAGAVVGEIGDLAGQPDQAETLLQHAPGFLVQAADGEDFTIRGQIHGRYLTMNARRWEQG